MPVVCMKTAVHIAAQEVFPQEHFYEMPGWSVRRARLRTLTMPALAATTQLSVA